MYVDTGASISEAMVSAFIALSRRLDLRAGPGGSRITPFESTDGVAILDGFLGPEMRPSIVALYPSSQLVAHRDAFMGATPRRFHVPLEVNDGCWVFHEGTWQQLEVGNVYQMDPTQLHGAVNWGTTVRTHLIIDTQKEQ